MRRVVLILSLAGSLTAWGQRAISAHSGMVNYVEGTVLLDGKSLDPKVTELPDVKNRALLAAEDGRAEVLLTPGAFLRVAENSSFRMISNQLWNTRVEVVSGSALVEIDELLKDNTITLQFGDTEIALLKKGLYRVDAGDPGSLRVYDGEAHVSLNGDGVTAHKGRQVDLGAVLAASNFDPKDTDSFYNWNARRAEYIATANVSSARSAGGMGYATGTGYSNGTPGIGQWAYNPWYGMYTYLPGAGYGYSPFGYSLYSPMTVGYLYPPNYGYGGGSSQGTIGPRVTPVAVGNPVPSRGSAAAVVAGMNPAAVRGNTLAASGSGLMNGTAASGSAASSGGAMARSSGGSRGGGSRGGR